MKTGQVVLILLGVAAAAAVGWLIVRPAFVDGDILTSRQAWEIDFSDPLLIGDLEDPFAYAGGDAVRERPGTGAIDLGRDGSGSLRLTLELDGTESILAEGVDVGGELEIRASLRAEETDTSGGAIYGSSGRGDARLPETDALLFGTAQLSISIDGETRGAPFEGLWSIADALRREDGSIGNQGLIFSPLLRDDTVFSDPSRLEVTLLVYGRDQGQTDSVVLHTVYRTVDVIRSPEETTSPN
jgi:hypothetical protein